MTTTSEKVASEASACLREVVAASGLSSEEADREATGRSSATVAEAGAASSPHLGNCSARCCSLLLLGHPAQCGLGRTTQASVCLTEGVAACSLFWAVAGPAKTVRSSATVADDAAASFQDSRNCHPPPLPPPQSVLGRTTLASKASVYLMEVVAACALS